MFLIFSSLDFKFGYVLLPHLQIYNRSLLKCQGFGWQRKLLASSPSLTQSFVGSIITYLITRRLKSTKIVSRNKQ